MAEETGMELSGDGHNVSVKLFAESALDGSSSTDDVAGADTKYTHNGMDGDDEDNNTTEATGLLTHADTHKDPQGGAIFTTARVGRWLKTFLLVALLLLASAAFGIVEELKEDGRLVAIIAGSDTELSLKSNRRVLEMSLGIPSNRSGTVSLRVMQKDGDFKPVESINLADAKESAEGYTTLVHRRVTLDSDPLALMLETNATSPVAISVNVAFLLGLVEYEVVFAALILVLVYVLIIFEIIHRALAAMLGAFLALGVLSVLGKQPALDIIVGWIDYETVMLLFGMMIIVGILSETGVFEWAAVQAYKLSNGNMWRLLMMLCMFSAVVSAFLDNVTTILLLTPVTIRMCNVIGLDPVPVLLAEVVFSNIGGTATAVGDPPNVIIVSYDWSAVDGKDIGFAEFTGHMCIGIVFVTIVSFYLLKFLYRNEKLDNPDPPELAEIKREIHIWQRTRNSIHPATSREEKIAITNLDAKIRQLQTMCDENRFDTHHTWKEKVQEMEASTKIRDKELLWDCIVVLSIVIIMFFIHSIPAIHLNLGWIAILGALSLLLLTGAHDLDDLLQRIEWGTLLFFAALFILMEALSELGLIAFIGNKTADLIKDVPEDSRLTVGMLLILWISALASAFIDNIPFTTAMAPIISQVASDPDVNVPLRPLVWALAFGACLGGNGTLIGASANVVCAGMAEQAGIPISFNRFFKIGFPMMLVSTTVAMIYLLICHSAIGWNS